MQKKLKTILIIIAILHTAVITACVLIPIEPEFGNPVDPDSSYYAGAPSIDLDGDGIGAYRDVDDIFLLFPEDDAVIKDDPFDFIVYEFDPSVVEKYHIQISRAKHYFEYAIVHDNNNIESNVYTLPEGILTNYVTYYWRASAYDGISWSNTWSEIRSFTLALPDYTPPAVLSVDPANGAVDVSVNSAIRVTFTENVDASSITAATFKVNDGYADGSVVTTGTIVIFTPSNALKKLTTYNVTITDGVKDPGGNALEEEYVWSFTTEPPPMPLITGLSDIVLAWDPSSPQFDREGELIPAESYNVYYRDHGDIDWVMLGSILAVDNPEYTVYPDLDDGEYDFAVSAVGPDDLESALHTSIDKDAYPAGGWYLIWEKY